MEICLQAALRLKSVPSFSGLADVVCLKHICSFVCYIKSSHKQCYPSLQTQEYLENTLISFHYPSNLHISLSMYSFM